jgi:2'-5' RNA ligase
MPRPNWFLAWPIEGSFLLECSPPAGFRKVHPEDAHITLAFLGGCGEENAGRALAALDELLERHPTGKLNAALGSVVPMGSKRAYSALSALLSHGRTEVENCIGQWRGALCAAACVRPDRRPPKAHATIARPRFRADEAQRARGLAWAASLSLGHVRLELERIALYTWYEPRGVRQFRIVAERALGKPDATD